MANKLSDPVTELGVVLSGESIERMATLRIDPDADLGPGQLARVGQAFSEIGGELMERAKDAVGDRVEGMVGASTRYVDAGVTFEWRKPTESTGVNAAEIKRTFPPAEYPELYKKSTRRGYVIMTFSDLG